MMEDKESGKREKKEEKGRETTATTPLERDVVALLATVADELATVDDHARKTNPEVLVGDHLRDRLSTVNLPVNDHTDDKVENNSSKKPVQSHTNTHKSLNKSKQ